MRFAKEKMRIGAAKVTLRIGGWHNNREILSRRKVAMGARRRLWCSSGRGSGSGRHYIY